MAFENPFRLVLHLALYASSEWLGWERFGPDQLFSGEMGPGWYICTLHTTKMSDICEFYAGQGVWNGVLEWLLLLIVYLFCRCIKEFFKCGHCMRCEACLPLSSTGFGRGVGTQCTLGTTKSSGECLFEVAGHGRGYVILSQKLGTQTWNYNGKIDNQTQSGNEQIAIAWSRRYDASSKIRGQRGRHTPIQFQRWWMQIVQYGLTSTIRDSPIPNRKHYQVNRKHLSEVEYRKGTKKVKVLKKINCGFAAKTRLGPK
ncbi:hypothetical protein L1987_71282 [Smallanthus sonchifolius]|uniref:Uncharacterized protein n=1 Tax=Smallanthus sonchifolius TaxID=185202 RepID=A0ACB9AR76_9ASTR|nr:hypothetical protein L1987_71282 [Smallanthus sonchifolius]